MNVLITGVSGMIGSHFANSTRARGWKTYGIARSSAASRLQATQDPTIFRYDLTDRLAVEAVFKKIRFDLIIHMGAQAFNGSSWEMENYTHHTNYLSTLNILQCARAYCPDAKVLIACSSAEYGNVPVEECPIREDRLLQPVSPYGVSKVTTECLGYQYFANYGMKVYLPRLFIHVGTGHPPATAIQNFARQLALISKGKAEPVMRVGRLTTARDFIDVRDGVEAMMMLLDRGSAGVPINICTGTAYKISDILEMLIETSKLKVEVIEDAGLLRPSDEPLLLGDNSRLKALGWTQKHTMRETLKAVYEDWVSRVDLGQRQV